MNSPEEHRLWQREHGRKLNRREFLRNAGIVGAAVAASAVGLYEWGKYNSGVSFEQKAADSEYKKAEIQGNIAEFEIINPDEENGRVNVRKNPSILNGNRIGTIDVGDEIKGILVSATGGREKFEPDLLGPWIAFKQENGNMGFVNSRYAERADGQELTKGLAIYNLTTGAAISWDSSSPK